jgi:hypothetical protein
VKPVLGLLAVIAATGSGGCAAGTATSSPVGRPIQSISGGGSPAETRQAPTAPLPAPLLQTEPSAQARVLKPARRAALRFFTAYLRFLYGETTSGQVRAVDPQLRSELQQPARLTPAERAARPVVAHVSVTRAGPPLSVLATATILVDQARYQLTATLEPQHGNWVVVAIGH